KHPIGHQGLPQEVLNENLLRLFVVPFPEVFGKESINELSKDTESESTEDHAMEDTKQVESGSSSSSEEIVSNIAEQKQVQKEDVPSERYLGYLEQLLKLQKYNLPQLEQKIRSPRELLDYFPPDMKHRFFVLPNYSKYNTELNIFSKELLHSMKEGIHAQQKKPMKGVSQELAYFYPQLFRQFYQLDAYPSGAWYYLPLGIQYTDVPSFSDIPNPIGSENSGKATMPLW
ncbi:hypothetical protein FD754_018154, partial [Muntiacus muntjak]